MEKDTTVVTFQHPEDVDDPLTEVLREGARKPLKGAVETEAEAFLAMMREERLADGRARFVRHGHGPERTIQTGIGPVPMHRAKVHDRTLDKTEHVTFTSAILPKWARRTKSELCWNLGDAHDQAARDAASVVAMPLVSATPSIRRATDLHLANVARFSLPHGRA